MFEFSNTPLELVEYYLINKNSHQQLLSFFRTVFLPQFHTQQQPTVITLHFGYYVCTYLWIKHFNDFYQLVCYVV